MSATANTQPPRDDHGTASARSTSSFQIPPSLKRLFDRFPLHTYPSNPLPERTPRRRDRHTLYIFTTPEASATDAPSFNPGCLKWQTYLHICNVAFQTQPSNNHASPSGALPFLLPSSLSSPSSTTPIPSTRLPSWTPTPPPPLPARQTPYTTLLSQAIRLAYLAALYLDARTFAAVAHPLYVAAASRSGAVQAALSYTLRAAALGEVLGGAGANAAGATLDARAVARLLEAADEAFGALGVLLGASEWFGDVRGQFEEEEDRGEGRGGPNMLDAAVFAYTHVILRFFDDEGEVFGGEAGQTPARRLARSVRERGNLVGHRTRVLARYYSKQ